MRQLMTPALLLVLLAGCAVDPLKPSPIPPSFEPAWQLHNRDMTPGIARNATQSVLKTQAELNYKRHDDRWRYRSKFFRSGSGRD